MEYQKQTLALMRDILLEDKGRITLLVTSESMAPLIKPQDILLVRSVIGKKIAPFDIVVFETGDSLCAHRLLMSRKNAEGVLLITKPDISLVADAPFNKQKLLGRVSIIEKQGRVVNLEVFPWRLINICLGFVHIAAYLAARAVKSIRTFFLKKLRHE